MTPVRSIFTVYVGRMFALRFVGLLAFFVIILQMLDLLNNSTEIAAAEGAGAGSLFRYILLRAPQIASQFTPFAALLSIVATLSSLNQRSEIAIMRAAGMSVHLVLFPIGFCCGVIAAVHFFAHELFVVSSVEKLAYWEANDYAVNLPIDDGTRTDIRFIQDNEIITAASATQADGRTEITGLRIYSLNERGLPNRITEARRALFENGAWSLSDTIRYEPESLKTVRADAVTWETRLDPQRLFSLTVNPDRTPLPRLLAQINDVATGGADTRSAMTSFLSRFSKPMSTLVMPLLGAIAGFGVARQGTQLVRAVTGAALGFGYFVLENLMIALGKLGAIPAVFGAFFPFLLFMVVGFAILLAMEN